MATIPTITETITLTYQVEGYLRATWLVLLILKTFRLFIWKASSGLRRGETSSRSKERVQSPYLNPSPSRWPAWLRTFTVITCQHRLPASFFTHLCVLRCDDEQLQEVQETQSKSSQATEWMGLVLDAPKNEESRAGELEHFSFTYQHQPMLEAAVLCRSRNCNSDASRCEVAVSDATSPPQQTEYVSKYPL